MESMHKIQISISVLLLVIAMASFLFGSGAISRYMSTGSAPALPQNSTEKNLIVGVWSMNEVSPPANQGKDADKDQEEVRASLIENWTFYPDGTFAESHKSVGSDIPPIYDHGTWMYLGNASYVISLNNEEIHMVRTGSSTLLNEDDQCTFTRIEY
jgi:hypothetical protein